MTQTTAPPIDIWEIAQTLVREDEDGLGVPHSHGPLDQDIEEKLSRFDSWEQIYDTSLTSMGSVLLVESFLNEVYGVTGLFRKE